MTAENQDAEGVLADSLISTGARSVAVAWQQRIPSVCRENRQFFSPINTTKGKMMKINEIVANAPQNNRMQPSVVKQQARVGKVVAQIAASDQQQAPTELDKVLAIRSYANLKKRADRTYAERLRQELAAAQANL